MVRGLLVRSYTWDGDVLRGRDPRDASEVYESKTPAEEALTTGLAGQRERFS